MDAVLTRCCPAFHAPRRVLLALLAAVALATPALGPGGQTAPGQWTVPDFAALFAAARDPAAAFDAKRFQYLAPNRMPADFAPLWPLHSFLLSETWLERGDTTSARKVYRDMVDWCASDPYHDADGASGLCVVALWRWLELDASASAAPPADRRALLMTGTRYWRTRGRVAQGMFAAAPILGALPQLREEVLRHMTALAWSLGERAQAHQWLREYLGIARAAPLSALEQEVLADAQAAQAFDWRRLALAWGKRLVGLGKPGQAQTLFLDARQAADPTVAADARLQLALPMRDAGGRACATPAFSAEVDAVLEASGDAELRQRALLTRARRHLLKACGGDERRFEVDLARLRAEFPHAHATFVALSELASSQLERWFDGSDQAALDRALRRFDEARDLLRPLGPGGDAAGRAAAPSVQALQGQAWFKPAIALYARGTAADQRGAAALLTELDQRWPDGPLRLGARFWRARIAAERGHAQESREQLRRIVDDSPYDYYAIRARLYLQPGAQAGQAVTLDPATRKALGLAFAAGTGQGSDAAAGSPYHMRLRTALAQGVYQAALASLFAVRKEALPGRMLEDVPLAELASAHRLLDVVLALALRQDALAAADRPANATNRLLVAGSVMQWPSPGWLRGDWPLAVSLSAPRNVTGALGRDLRADARFLAVAYPRAFQSFIEQSAAQYKLPPELLYAVMRTETIFNPAAESNRAALGLFQFIPSTFRGLNAKWRLVDGTDPGAAETFLLTPQTNIQLGARWFAMELLPGQDGKLLWALMAHNAGPATVARWKSMWWRLGRADDLDFMVETARFDETRGFVQRALTAFWIAQAAGLFAQTGR